MKYDDFKSILIKELNTYNIKIDTKIIAIIYKVVANIKFK